MRIFLCILLLFYGYFVPAEAVVVNNITVQNEALSEFDYKNNTVLKHYKPMAISLVNRNNEPVKFSAESKIKYIDKNGAEHLLPDEKDVYKKSRKRDVGRYCWVAIPAALLGGAVTGITFGLGIIAGLGITFAGMMPMVNAVQYNSSLAGQIFVENGLPLNLKTGQFYMVYIFVPEKEFVKTGIEKLVITNMSLKDNQEFNIEIPVSGENL